MLCPLAGCRIHCGTQYTHKWSTVHHLHPDLEWASESEQLCCNGSADDMILHLCLCYQEETHHLLCHSGPLDERGDLTGMHCQYRRAEDGEPNQNEVDQVRQAKI